MHVTVCICTRDRGEIVGMPLRGILNSHYRDFDIVIVDQSTSDVTARAVERAVAGNKSVAYVRSRSIGLSKARNIAVGHATGPIVAFTDDDCEVPAEWLSLLAHAFDTHPTVSQVCGPVRPGPYSASAGFIPCYTIARDSIISSPWAKWREGSIGANMAFRLTALRVVGAFDEVLGSGAPLFSCEDGDMTYRILKAGYQVLNVPDAYVIHHGFRNWAQGQTLMRNTGAGVGAAYMKHLRLGDPAIVPTLIVEWMRCISWRRLFRLQRHSGLGRFLAYARGMVISFRYPIDRERRTYRSRESSAGYAGIGESVRP